MDVKVWGVMCSGSWRGAGSTGLWDEIVLLSRVTGSSRHTAKRGAGSADLLAMLQQTQCLESPCHLLDLVSYFVSSSR